MRINLQDGKIIWFFYKPYKFKFIGLLVLMFLAGLLEAWNLASLYPIINYGLHLDRKDFFLRAFGKIAQYIVPDNPFLSACILLIIISILAIAFRLSYNYFSNKLSIQIMGDTQKKIFDKFISANYGFYVRNQQGKLIYAGTSAIEKMADVIFYTMAFVYQFFNTIFLFSLLVLLSWKATLLILLLGLFYGLVVRNVLRKNINQCALIRTEESQNKNIILNEFITGIKTIKVFLAAGDWKQRYERSVDRGLDSIFRMSVATAFPETFIKFLFYILIALTGIIFSLKPHQDVITLLPVLGTFVIVVNRFLPSLYVLGSNLMAVVGGMPGAKIVYELFREDIVADVEGEKLLNDFNNNVTFENVWFRYPATNDHLLKGISFIIEKKKMTALVGLSGAGKTTIINLLLKLYRVDKGSIKIDGTDILELDNKTYLSRIGYVSQETFIFNNSIKENIRFGMDDCTDQMIEDAAKLANAHDFIVETQLGYNTMVGDSGVKLSGGQRQRVAIARAMLRKPQIIVFDEATSSLDNISEKKIQKAINEISKHTTVLVIAHRLSTVQNADKIIILEKGDIKEQGTHDELLKNKGHYYDLHVSKDNVDEGFVKEKVDI